MHSAVDGVDAIFVPPYAWYRLIEFFWHGDYAGVNWEKVLKNDLKSCNYFLTQSINPDINLFRFNEDIKEFSYIILIFSKISLKTKNNT